MIIKIDIESRSMCIFENKWFVYDYFGADGGWGLGFCCCSGCWTSAGAGGGCAAATGKPLACWLPTGAGEGVWWGGID